MIHDPHDDRIRWAEKQAGVYDDNDYDYDYEENDDDQ